MNTAVQEADDIKLPDPLQMTRTWIGIAETSQRLVNEFLRRQMSQGHYHLSDPLGIGKAFSEMTHRLLANPAKLVEAQIALWQGYLDLWHKSSAAFFGHQVEPAVKPGPGDRRFKDDAWQRNFVFDYIKQSYLLTARWLQDVVGEVEGLDPKTKKKLDFYTRQFVDALAPTNFPITNPEVLRVTLESGGENLLKGLRNLLKDLENSKGKLRIRHTDLQAFDLGKNIALTPGKVIYQTELMQLIQYNPSTAEVYRRPLLVIPPWINKYYILDLREKNSFVKWWVDQGFTVFMVSWVNPDEALADKDFEDYLTEGTLAALDAIEQATGEREVNAVGYCLGGTLLGVTMGYLAKRRINRIRTCTYFATMLDFSHPGELEVFIDEEQISSLEETMNKRGYLDGAEMATTFNMLRANDLIWSFFVNNYLLGKEPFPFDLLYWNADSTRMPAKMHSFYLRNMYQKNLLRKPDGLSLAGSRIDLSRVKVPTYFVATIEDHIAPWKSTYAGTQLFTGPVRFVLGGSGHIAGIINPPTGGKYGYWINEQTPTSAEEWFAHAAQHEGSWWGDWLAWITPEAGDKIPARQPGDGQLPVLEDAPGSYVKTRPA
ncbi:MAG: class I poly(R)-hydroxyalkanoic acid synthase [Gammaproteobacteria bacterium]